MKARLGAGRANLQRAGNQINRHDVAGVPDDGGEVKPSAQSRLAIAECINGDDLALDRLQRALAWR